MEILVQVTEATVLAVLFVIGTAVFLRSILPLFVSEDSLLFAFCCVLSEPLVAPVRSALGRTALAELVPVDLSNLATYLLILLLQSFLLSVS